jgi:hypothetical protein
MLDLHLAKGDVDKSKVGRYDAKMSRVSVGVKTEARWGKLSQVVKYSKLLTFSTAALLDF